MNIQSIQYLSQLPPLTSQEIYLVGGSVRDLLIGLPDVKDIDIVMSTGSTTVAQKFANKIKASFFLLDEERKVTRVVKQTDAGILQFDFTDFIGADLNADLGRRDFTLNAMALDLREYIKDRSIEKTIDLFQGKEDIQRKTIRVVKPEVLDEDPLRLLRAVRFAATLGFEIEDITRDDIRARAALITEPSPERIRDEFFQILAQRGAGIYIELMDSLGLLSKLLPEMDKLTGFSPGIYHSYDVRTHSIKAAGYVDDVLDDLPKISPEHAYLVSNHLESQLEFFVPRKAALRFACLLHDVAKPDTLSQDKDGHIHFYGHDNLGAEKAKETCRRFRLSRDTESLVTSIIKQHMRLFNLSKPGGPSKNAMYRYCRELRDALPESLILAQADARATYDIMPREKFMNTEKPMAVLLNYYYERFLRTEAKPLATGQDLIDRGFQPGPQFREILDEVKERQAEGSLKNREDALRYLETLK